MILINFCSNHLLKNLFVLLFCQSIFFNAKTDQVDLSLSKEKDALSIAASINLARELEKLSIEDYPDLIESVN